MTTTSRISLRRPQPAPRKQLRELRRVARGLVLPVLTLVVWEVSARWSSSRATGSRPRAGVAKNSGRARQQRRAAGERDGNAHPASAWLRAGLGHRYPARHLVRPLRADACALGSHAASAAQHSLFGLGAVVFALARHSRDVQGRADRARRVLPRLLEFALRHPSHRSASGGGRTDERLPRLAAGAARLDPSGAASVPHRSTQAGSASRGCSS